MGRYIAILILLFSVVCLYGRTLNPGIDNHIAYWPSISAPPDLDLPSQLVLCQGETLTIDPQITGVSYLWSDGSQNQTLLVTVPGVYSLTITDSSGSDSDTVVVIDGGNGPILELGADIIGCQGETIVLSPNVNNVSYVWQDGSTGPTFPVTTTGTYELTVTNACGSDSDAINIDLNTFPPDAILGKDTVLCEGTTLTLISLPEPGTVSTWQDGSSFNFYTVFAPGTYILTQVNSCGIDSDTINITYGTPPPFVNLGQDTTLCEGATLLLTAPPGTNMITWQDGSEGNNFLVTEPGTYSISVSNRCGTRTNAIEVFYDVQPFSFPAEDKINICESEIYSINVEQSIAAFYNWSTGESTPSIMVTNEGQYSVTVSTNCKEESRTYEVFVNDCIALKQLYIPNVITPNGDGINDALNVFIHPEADIRSITGSIYDRWGNNLYTSVGEVFSWNGKSGDHEVLPGTYVYVFEILLKVRGLELLQRRSGDITVLR